jgi:glycosyltransferase involved in cell wall biosynthesis
MTNGKKILRIIARLNIGGPSIHVTNLNYYLDKNYGYSSTLVYGSLAEGEGSMEYLATDKNLTTIVLPGLGREINFKKDIRTIIDLYKIIKKEKPDIVHTHTAKAGTVGRIAAILARTPKIYHTFHGHVFHSYFGFLKTLIFIYIEILLGLFTTKIIAISEKQKRELVGYHIAPAHKIAVIPLGFDLKAFCNSLEPSYWHKKLNLPAETKLVGIVGRLAPVKNHQYFIDIAQEVLKTRKDIAFLIIGDGESRMELEKLKTPGVIFCGFENDPKKIYSDLDVVALTSKNEGTPVTLIEALACGKPVVTTGVGGIPDVIHHKQNGLIIPENNPTAGAAAIIWTLTNSTQATKMAETGQREILNRYDVQRLVGDIHRLYL